MNRNKILVILSVVFLGLCIGCFLQYQKKPKETSCTKQLFAMDTFMTFTAVGKESETAVDAAIEEVKRLETLLSCEKKESEIFYLNKNKEGKVSKETEVLLEKSLKFYRETEGLFDITIYPLMELWGFPSRNYKVPSNGELLETLSLVDASKIQLKEGRVTLGEGQKIDLGGIAKGYTAERIMELYQEYNVSCGYVSLGGNVQTKNRKSDGSLWRIGIQHPKKSQGELIAVVEVESKAVVTSGGYERYFEQGGKVYSHIIDPKTGYPEEGNLSSVTVISEDGILADALSTSLYLMGEEKAKDYWRQHREEFEMVLIDTQEKIQITQGLLGVFQTEENYEVLK